MRASHLPTGLSIGWDGENVPAFSAVCVLLCGPRSQRVEEGNTLTLQSRVKSLDSFSKVRSET